MTSPDWTGAACIGHDPEIWYPDPTDVIGTREAVDICRGCPVKQACLEQAMLEEPAGGRHGIRGGLTPEDRRKLDTRASACPDCGRRFTAVQMRRHHLWCASTRETIRLHQQGMPWAEIARIQGLHHTTVNARIHHWRAEHGDPETTHNPRERVDDYLEEVRWLLSQGEPPERAAQRVGVTAAAIARSAYRHGDHELAASFARIQSRDRKAKTT